jgi:hypothetical protein
MIVLLTDEVFLTLDLLKAINLKIQGLLIGHLRGNAIIIEKIISLGSNLPTPEQILKINKLLENKLVGFFTFNSEENSLKDLLTPLYAGNVLLKIGKKTQELKAYLIDIQENRMIFSPVKIRSL